MRRPDVMDLATVLPPAAAAAWWWAGQAPTLAPPPACAGLLETLGAAALRTWPTASIASPLLLLHLIGSIITVAVLALAVRRLSGSALAGAATGVACAASLMFAPALGMPDTIVFAAAAFVWLGLTRMAGVGGASQWTLIGLMTVAVLSPSLRVAAAATIAGLAWPAWRARHRGAMTSAAAWTLAALVIPAAISSGTPALPFFAAASRASWSCSTTGASASDMATLAGIGPLVALLILAGIVDRALSWPRYLVGIAAVWLAAAASVVWPGDSATMRSAAPVITGAWLLAGCGLGAVVAQARRARWANAAAVVVTTALVLVVVSPRLPGALPPPARPMPLGHASLTNAAARALLLTVPSGSLLVREDAFTDLHLRALSGRLVRLGTFLQSVPPDVDTLLTARTHARIFAWPAMQTLLQRQGLHIDTTSDTAAAGLAEITGGGRCLIASTFWQPMSSLIGAPGFTFVSSSTTVRGPVVLWLDGMTAIDATRHHWPDSAQRGFQRVVYELPGDARDAATQRNEDGAPAMTANSSAVTRVEVWRTPEAPLSLSVTLTAPPMAAYVRLSPQATDSVRVCPSFPGDVKPIPPPR